MMRQSRIGKPTLLVVTCCFQGLCFQGLFFQGASGQTIWTGPDVSISQSGGAPQSVIDTVLPGVASLTRGSDGLLCNTIAGDTCAAFQPIPSDFEFAFSNLNGNGPIAYGSAASFANFTFANMQASLPGGPGNVLPNAGNTQPPRAGIVHHVPSNTYFDIEIQNWGRGNVGPSELGAFSYRRSSPIPEPAAISLFGIACGLFGLVRRR